MAGTGTSQGSQEWTLTPASPGRRHASGVPPDAASFPAVMSFLASLREELPADMVGRVKTLTAGRTPGTLASPGAGIGSSGSRVVTGGDGGDDGGSDGSTSWDSRRDLRSRRSRRSHRHRSPRSSSSASSSRSDGKTVRRALVDFEVPVHKNGDSVPNTGNDWPSSYRLDNYNQTLASRIRLRMTQDRKKLRFCMGRVRFDGPKPAELLCFLHRLIRACNDSIVWE